MPTKTFQSKPLLSILSSTKKWIILFAYTACYTTRGITAFSIGFYQRPNSCIHKSTKQITKSMQTQEQMSFFSKHMNNDKAVYTHAQFISSSLSLSSSSSSIEELDRRQGYEDRNYTWPIPLENYKPSITGWKRLFERRFGQISRMPSNLNNDDKSAITDKYNGWLSAVTSAIVLQNFTKYGWGITRAPDDLVHELRNILLDGVNNGKMRSEIPIEIIQENKNVNEHNKNKTKLSNDNKDKDNILPAMFVDLPINLTSKAVTDLRPLHEQFASVPISPNGVAYGLRLYRNNSKLLMHIDKPETRIIASLLHLGRSDDAENWPIVIEDFNGNTVEVFLEVGDLFLYESAKVYHGRPKPFCGTWYTSLLTHYYPEGWDTENFHWEGHYAVPPHWFEENDTDANGIDNNREDELYVIGTGLMEPNCDNGWKGLKDSIQIYGPAKPGIIETFDSDQLRKLETNKIKL